jgi:hypothetical protein
VGIILFEMLAGQHPWRRSAPTDTMYAILHEPPPLDSVYDGLVKTLLRKDREERYASAAGGWLPSHVAALSRALALMRSLRAIPQRGSNVRGNPSSERTPLDRKPNTTQG